MLITLGATALEIILKKAKHLYTNGYDNVYLKSGGYKQALEDFYSVSPTRVREISKEKTTGMAGNLRMTLRYNSPALTMSKKYQSGMNPVQPVNVIIYTD